MRAIRKSFKLLVERLEERLTPTDDPTLPVPVLNSLPGAPATLYLDFNGHFDTSWSSFNNVDTPPFDTTGATNTLDATEIQQITEIWRYVAEDFAPLNINVSTVLPSNFNRKVAQRVAIGGDGAWEGSGGLLGIALLDSFNTGSGPTETCYVFAENHVTNFLQNVAFTISHEGGHTFGLEHQSDFDASGNETAEYGAGLTDGTSPILGGNDTATRNMYWVGPTTSATTIQDDMAVLSNSTNGFGYRADDVGDNTAAATLLVGTGSGLVNVSKSGIIGSMADADWFSFKALAGPITFTVDVQEPYNNLDSKIELRDSSGNLLASDDPSGSFDATVSATAARSGTYYVVVQSHGLSSAATPNNHGIDVGGYTVNGSFIVDVAAQAAAGAGIRVLGPVRWKYNAKSKTYSALITLMSSTAIAGPITFTVKLPHRSVKWLSPGGTQSGGRVTLTLNQDILAKKPFYFTAVVKNPLRKNLGTFFKGLKMV